MLFTSAMRWLRGRTEVLFIAAVLPANQSRI